MDHTENKLNMELTSAPSPENKVARSIWWRMLFICLAWLCIALGVLGIFIPVYQPSILFYWRSSLRRGDQKSFINGY